MTAATGTALAITGAAAVTRTSGAAPARDDDIDVVVDVLSFPSTLLISSTSVLGGFSPGALGLPRKRPRRGPVQVDLCLSLLSKQ